MSNNLDEWEREDKFPATIKKVCPQCGRKFSAVVPWAIYDTDACKQAAYRDRKEKEQKQKDGEG